MKIVFICRGNMFRSQVAEALCRQMLGNNIDVSSFGTAVEAESREGHLLSSYPELSSMLSEMKKDGLDLYNNTPKQLKEEYLLGVDKIIVMSEPEYTPSWLSKYKFEFWKVENPISADAALSRKIIEDIRSRVQGIFANELKFNTSL